MKTVLKMCTTLLLLMPVVLSANVVEKRIARLEKRVVRLENIIKTRSIRKNNIPTIDSLKKESENLKDLIASYEVELDKYRKYFIGKTSIKKKGIRKRTNKISLLKRRYMSTLRRIENLELKSGIKGKLVI